MLGFKMQKIKVAILFFGHLTKFPVSFSGKNDASTKFSADSYPY